MVSLSRSMMLLVLLTAAELQFAHASWQPSCSGVAEVRRRRPETVSITEFGGVGDGRTLNTEAFKRAVYRIAHLRRRGGTTLYIPAGVWLTGSFNLTSHMTLFLAVGAVIKATTETRRWPLMEPLPSYGRGRELPGWRYTSLLHGDGVRDVEITGDNGTIDGDGEVWWDMWRRRSLRFTRPGLLELMNSEHVVVSNLVFVNSPFWNIHTVYSNNVAIRRVTILAPHDSPNTDGIDPDSSTNICIEDCFISTGDDLVSVKSGWDEYGIAFGRRSSAITIRRVSGSSPFAGVSIGSEVSGGVEGVLAENLDIFRSGIGIHIKTAPGRGGYIRNITFSGIRMAGVGQGLRISGSSGDHPDEKFDPAALTAVDGLTFKDVLGVEVGVPGSIEGIPGSPFTRLCLENVKFFGVGRREVPWSCVHASGASADVQPWPCSEMMMNTISGSFCLS